ncbi:MAG: DNA polymerase III subunit alpha, partial [Pseudomonadota bacterium]
MFVHLNVHSEYSLADSTIRVKPLIKRVGELGMPAVALTDLHNTFALVKFFRAAEGAGIKPIAGADVWVASPEEDDQQYRLTLLCQDHGGFLSLSRLLSEGYAHRQLKTLPVVQQEWVEQEQSGLIALAGGRDGEFGHHIATGRADLARESLTRWMSVFDDDRFYVDIARLGRPGEEGYNDAALALANQAGCPVVATNDVRFMGSDDFDAHEARVCIATGRVLNDSSRPRNYTPEQYLKSPVEMQERFADLPGALDNAVELAKRCNLELKLGTYFLPEFPVPEGRTVESHLELESQAGLERRVERRGIAEGLERKEYDDRLALELGVINQMGFPGYFLIVADFIQWAKDHDIPVGPGRGSGAGSLVAYALGITDLDPLEYDLLFERFLNPERVSMPDFDVDFCMDRRDEVIDYVGDHYGRDRVCQIITYGSMNAKAVIRDVGRVLGHPYGYVDSIAKLIPPTLGIKLDEAIAESEELRERMGAEEDVGELVELALKLEGLTRNAGKHAGGVVIAPGPLTDFSPLYSEAGGESVVTQFDKDDVESAGLVKFDFLGLRTLTIIDWALAAINKRRGAEGKDPLDINKVPMDDKGTFELLQSTKTTAVFQLESRGMKELIGRLKPESFDDIVALVALYRPGPLDSGMVDTYVDCKHGRQDVVYPHESLEEILNTTYGVILYQEQVMQIAQVLSGYTLGGADILRRAMGKKKPEEMAKQRATFVDGAKGNDVDPQVAESIFDLIEKFAGYGFNKSHSAAYALLSYQTAYLKHHHAADFMAAVMSSDMDSTDKVVNFIDDARATGLDLEPPNVNRSRYPFVASDDHTIVYGLGAIKGVGHSAIDAIIEVREEDGPYRDLLDFCRRIDLGKVNRRVIEALIQAGAMDDLGP